MKTISIDIEGMHCEGCVSRVQTALSEVRDVETVDVSLDDGKATVSAGDGAGEAELVEAVERAGYSASVER